MFLFGELIVQEGIGGAGSWSNHHPSVESTWWSGLSKRSCSGETGSGRSLGAALCVEIWRITGEAVRGSTAGEDPRQRSERAKL